MPDELEREITVTRRLKLTVRTCATCGNPFPGWGQQKFCSTACQKRADYREHADDRRAAARERSLRQKAEQAAHADRATNAEEVR
jgi:endogenous inhibitor of DNA gyrase (YacG/DUF329 family)